MISTAESVTINENEVSLYEKDSSIKFKENPTVKQRAEEGWKQPLTLLDILREEKAGKYSGGIYHKTQIDLTYNSNHMEGSRLSHDQTRYIFETNTCILQ